ncbi:MAG: DUF1361 domain-containing protein [Spirochaetia bacterium]|nr:DUF1361 domain-containing protein [Spirochaetia bacterium]
MKNLFRVRYLQIIGLYTLFNIIYISILNFYMGNQKYNFLLWNLFLGFVPFAIAFVMRINISKLNTFVFIFGIFLWLLFYPNAPYMVTDLIHVDQDSTRVLYETLMLFSFAMQALFLGFYSLKLMWEIFNVRFKKLTANIIIFIAVLLSSFGIFLGRILRLNSWDVFTHPFQTLKTILEHLFPISSNPATYAVIIIFTLIQLLLLSSIRDLEEI